MQRKTESRVESGRVGSGQVRTIERQSRGGHGGRVVAAARSVLVVVHDVGEKAAGRCDGRPSQPVPQSPTDLATQIGLFDAISSMNQRMTGGQTDVQNLGL